MKRTITALVAGVVLGTTGLGVAASHGRDTWVRNGVLCTTTGVGKDRGVVCGVTGNNSKVVSIITQTSVIVARKGKITYMTGSR